MHYTMSIEMIHCIRDRAKWVGRGWGLWGHTFQNTAVNKYTIIGTCQNHTSNFLFKQEDDVMHRCTYHINKVIAASTTLYIQDVSNYVIVIYLII